MSIFRSLNRTESVADTDVAVPASLADAVSFPCRVFDIEIVNPTAGSLSVTVTDKTSGNAIIPTRALLPGGSVSFTCARGRLCPTGFQWQATGTGLTAHLQVSQA